MLSQYVISGILGQDDIVMYEYGKANYFIDTYLNPMVTELRRKFPGLTEENFPRKKTWPFPIFPKEGQVQYQQLPTSAFQVRIREFPHCLVEFASKPPDNGDRFRMLNYGGTLVRIAGALTPEDSPSKFGLMALYVNETLCVDRYLIFQGQNNQVQFVTRRFNLLKAEEYLRFLVELYNFPSVVQANLTALAGSEWNTFYFHTVAELFPTNPTTGADNDKGDEEEEWTRRNPDTVRAVVDRGYDVDPELASNDDGSDTVEKKDAVEKGQGKNEMDEDEDGDEMDEDKTRKPKAEPTIDWPPVFKATRRADGQVCLLKRVKDEQHLELESTRFSLRSSTRTTTPFLCTDVIPASPGSIFVAPLGVHLMEVPDLRTSAPILLRQLLDGVRFMHCVGIAHLDLNPDNLVVVPEGKLHITGFGSSSMVANRKTLAKGYRGTTPWVAPEVGTKDGTAELFNPIAADLWATGRVIGSLCEHLTDDEGAWLLKLSSKLTNDNPDLRPSLEDVVTD